MDVEAWRAANRPIVLDRIRRGEPVAITLMAYPFKVPNPCKVGARILPDLAELASLMYLRHLHESVQYLHPPGIRLTIIHDGQYLNGVFGIPPQEVLAYEEYFARMLRRFHLDTFIRTVNFNALLAPQEAAIRCRRRELVSAARRWATSAAHAGEQLKAFQKTLGMMNLRRLPPAERNALAGGAPPSRDHMCNHAHGTELRRAVDRAMRRYFLLDLILHRFDPRPLFFPDAIHATTKIRRGRLRALAHGAGSWRAAVAWRRRPGARRTRSRAQAGRPRAVGRLRTRLSRGRINTLLLRPTLCPGPQADPIGTTGGGLPVMSRAGIRQWIIGRRRPLISTVVLNWNRSHLLKRLIESYLDTIRVSYELFIVDNGSTDDSRGIIERASRADPRHRSVFLPENVGGRAINEGLRLARGRFLHVAPNDAEYLPGWDEDLLGKFEIFPELGLLSPFSGDPRTHRGDPADRLPVTQVTRQDLTIYRTDTNIGTTSICRRALWDRGFRWGSLPREPGSEFLFPDDGAPSRFARSLGYWVAWNDRFAAVNWGHRAEEWAAHLTYYLANYRAKPWLREEGLRRRLRDRGYELVEEEGRLKALWLGESGGATPENAPP